MNVIADTRLFSRQISHNTGSSFIRVSINTYVREKSREPQDSLRANRYEIARLVRYSRDAAQARKKRAHQLALLTGTVIYTRRGRKLALNGGLAEQIDRIRVGSGRVGAHARVRFQTLASAHQKHLLRRYHAAFPLDRLLQLGDAATEKSIMHE